MIREERTIFLTLLTFFIYGLLQVFDKGVFLFPFPLNEPAIFLVFIYLSILNRQKFDILYSVFGLFCLFRLISQQFFWSIFLPQDSLQFLYNEIWIDLFYLLSGLFYLFFVFLLTAKQEGKYLNYLRFFIVFVYVLGIILSLPIIELFSFFLLYIFAWKYSINRIFKSLIGLVIVLETGKFLMLLY